MSTRRPVIEGCVDERRTADGEEIVACTLIDESGWTYYAEIDVDRFPEADQPLLEPGVLFTIREPGPEVRIDRRRSKKKCQCQREGCCA